jgi:hypothetical protein
LPAQRLGEIITHPMARPKKTPPKQPLVNHSITLTPPDAETLRQLSQDAKDYIGRTVSVSAIVRVLVRYAGQQGEAWARERLFPFVEQELNAGVMWGKKQ